jgi:hydrogenase-4 component B
VKFFGVIFLGQSREPARGAVQDAGVLERIGLAWLALGCFVLGLFPTQVIGALRSVLEQFKGVALAQESGPWWLLAPMSSRHASYSAPIFFVAITAVVILTITAVGFLYHRRARRTAPWDCGFGGLTARMQDTAEGFGQPIRHIFGVFFAMRRELPSPFDTAPRYHVTVGDWFWQALYLPLGGLVQRVADVFARLQQGRIATYLLYSFVTLVVLLALVL